MGNESGGLSKILCIAVGMMIVVLAFKVVSDLTLNWKPVEETPAVETELEPVPGVREGYDTWKNPDPNNPSGPFVPPQQIIEAGDDDMPELNAPLNMPQEDPWFKMTAYVDNMRSMSADKLNKKYEALSEVYRNFGIEPRVNKEKARVYGYVQVDPGSKEYHKIVDALGRGGGLSFITGSRCNENPSTIDGVVKEHEKTWMHMKGKHHHEVSGKVYNWLHTHEMSHTTSGDIPKYLIPKLK